MFNSDCTDLLKILRIPSHERTEEEHDYIFAFLRGIDELKHYRETLLKSIAWIIRHQQFTVPNTVIYSNGHRITCWYILLSGSIFLGGKMFLPITCFGRRIGKDTYRREDCIALEACDLLVIDTPDLENRPVAAMNYPHYAGPGGLATTGAELGPQGHQLHHGHHGDRLAVLHSKHHAAAAAAASPEAAALLLSRLSDPAVAKRMSHSSDTSSAYSGSGELDSSVQNCDSDEELQLRGLDSDLATTGPPSSSSSAAHSQATTAEQAARRSPLLTALEKEPKERTPGDIELLLEAFQRLHAFANFTRATQRQFAQCMLYAVVEQSGQVVLDDGERLDSWSVIVDGEVEIQKPGSPPVQLHCGDAFGVKPTTEKQHHVGVMRSMVPNCRFAFITQEQYCRVLSSEAENSIEVRASDGSLQLVKEIRTLESGTLKKQHTVIRGTPQALIDQLLDFRSGSSTSTSDANYADDLLLTYRTFLDTGAPVAKRLLEALSNADQASRAVRVFLLWTNNHFEDFDASPELFRLLRQFERQLELREDTRGAQNLLRIACSTKSRPRKVRLLQQHQAAFHFADRLCYVRDVAAAGGSSGCDLRCGDRLLQADGVPVEQTPVSRLRDLLTVGGVQLTVRWDPLGFQKLLVLQQQQQQQAMAG